MLTKTNICSCKIILEGTLIVRNLKMMKKMLTLPPWKNFWGCPWMIALSRFVFSLFSCFHSLRIIGFFTFYNFGCKMNRINPLLVIISSKLPAITNVIYTNYHGCCRLF